MTGDSIGRIVVHMSTYLKEASTMTASWPGCRPSHLRSPNEISRDWGADHRPPIVAHLTLQRKPSHTGKPIEGITTIETFYHFSLMPFVAPFAATLLPVDMSLQHSPRVRQTALPLELGLA